MLNMETGHGSDHDDDTVHTTDVILEDEDDVKPSALILSSHELPAPRGVSASTTGGGGGGGQTAEEQQASTSTPVLLYPVNTERFFTTSTDGKTYLKIAPATGMNPRHSDKPLLSGSSSDFSSKAVLCLIEAVGRRWGFYDTRERSQLFQSVQEEMASKGHILPVEKIRRKWNNLIVTYKRVKDRGRETGCAKTSWEFFDLMDATLCDTVGSQLSNHKRSKPQPVTKIVVTPHLAQPSQTLLHNPQASSATSVTTVTISPSTTADIKPLIVLNGDLVPTAAASTTSTSSSTSSPSLKPPFATTSSSSTTNIDLSTARFIARQAPAFTSGILPLRLGTAQFGQNVPLQPTASTPNAATSTTTVATAASSVKAGSEEEEERSTGALVREVLKRQEEQLYLERVARRRAEAREKRRERREERMAESLGRVATALELLSSKQDTVIALLQRLADRK